MASALRKYFRKNFIGLKLRIFSPANLSTSTICSYLQNNSVATVRILAHISISKIRYWYNRRGNYLIIFIHFQAVGRGLVSLRCQQTSFTKYLVGINSQNLTSCHRLVGVNRHSVTRLFEQVQFFSTNPRHASNFCSNRESKRVIYAMYNDDESSTCRFITLGLSLLKRHKFFATLTFR